MRRILLLSDTHGHFEPGLIKHIDSCDEVWHAGDIGDISFCRTIIEHKPLKAVFGNIDGADIRAEYPENLFFNCEDVKVFMTHIGGYPGKYPARIKELLLQHKPQLFICGHSHILKVMYDQTNHLLHINPGACGVQGFHKVKTSVKFVIEKKEIKDLQIIEFGKRG